MAGLTGSNYISYVPVAEQSYKGRCSHAEIRVNSMRNEGTLTARHCLLGNVSKAFQSVFEFRNPKL